MGGGIGRLSVWTRIHDGSWGTVLPTSPATARAYARTILLAADLAEQLDVEEVAK